MNERTSSGIRFFAILLAALTYLAGVIYGDVMFLSFVGHAFPTGFLATLAAVGAVATAVSAVTLPLALHFWFAPGKQFMFGILFWIADLVVLSLNAILAYAIATGSTDLAGWQQISPATPMLAVFGWGMIFLLDPSHQLRHAQLGLQAAQTETFSQRLEAAAKSEIVTDTLNTAANDQAAAYARLLAGINIAPVGKTAPPAPAALALVHSTNGHTPASPNGHGPDPKANGR